MNRIYKTLALAALLLTSINAQTLEYKEGVHYKDIKLETSATPSIIEFFSFYCPACYQFEQTVHYLEDYLAPTKVAKIHVNFLSAAPTKIQDEFSKALILAEKVGFAESFSHAAFHVIHEQNQRFRTPADVWQLVAQVGPSFILYDRLANAPAITEEFEKRQKLMEMLSKMRALTGVPTLVINNRYIPNAKSVSTNQEYFDLVKHLVEKR